jgi:hypothetical protein
MVEIDGHARGERVAEPATLEQSHAQIDRPGITSPNPPLSSDIARSIRYP